MTVEAEKSACCCRQAMNDGFPSDVSVTGRGAIKIEPGISLSEYHCRAGAGKKFQRKFSRSLSKGSVHANEPCSGNSASGCAGRLGRWTILGTI